MGALFFRKKKNDLMGLDPLKLPSHIAIIMDGNGRWAKKRGMPRSFGHKEGGKTLKNIARYCSEIGIDYLTLYAFSTENWVRPKEEVDYLMDLLMDYLIHLESHLDGEKIRIRVIGHKEGLPLRVQEEIQKAEQKTQYDRGLCLNLAINYGSHSEILHAFQSLYKKINDGTHCLSEITKEDIERELYTSYMPSPDLLIRTGGEKRLSNYLLWQCAYSELYFTDVYWPDFSNKDLEEILRNFQKRERRYGGIRNGC
jgi:undecaprenyl diphosphate synthase